MNEENEKRLSELACKLSSMVFVLKGCCMYYEGAEFDSAKLVDSLEILNGVSNELFDLM